MRVAIQGEAGAFSHQAALELLGPATSILPCPSFDALFAAAQEGPAEAALAPIENSLTGSIHENYDRLAASTLHIVAEHMLRVRQCLIARPGASLATLRRVASHPVALAQCRTFFAAHPQLVPVPAYDTAGSVRDLPGDSPDEGAIASRLAAELYGCQVLQEGIEDDAQNYTRFLLLAREPRPLAAPTKTSLMFVLENVPGALHQALSPFATRGVDLARIESRPLRGRPWQYAFYLDVLGDPGGAAGEALRELQPMCRELRVLGRYADGLRPAPAQPSGWSPPAS